MDIDMDDDTAYGMEVIPRQVHRELTEDEMNEKIDALVEDCKEIRSWSASDGLSYSDGQYIDQDLLCKLFQIHRF